VPSKAPKSKGVDRLKWPVMLRLQGSVQFLQVACFDFGAEAFRVSRLDGSRRPREGTIQGILDSRFFFSAMEEEYLPVEGECAV
jgi:hypothetical protein